MNSENMNAINTRELFTLINRRREENGRPLITEGMLAAKLGILLAMRSGRHQDFKQATVQLSGRQIIALESLLEEILEVNLYGQLHDLVK